MTGPDRTEHAARLVDISEGGACIAGGPMLAPGASGSLFLDAAGAPLPFTVRDAENNLLRVAFTLDRDAASRLQTLLDRLEETRRAA